MQNQDNIHPNPPMPRVRDSQYREIYSNLSQTQLSPFDVSIIFQKASEVVPGQMFGMDLVSVSFSPQHFKALVNSMIETLKAYETAYGDLKIPDVETAPSKTSEQILNQIREQKDKSKANSSSSEAQVTSNRSRSAYSKKLNQS